MADSVHLVLIETAGNQAYIFATNRLRENIGASEIIYRIGTEFVLEAVANVGGPSLHDSSASHPLRLAQRLVGQDLVESPSAFVEVIVATSGKALLLVKDRKIGEEIVASVTRRTLEEAPGAVVRGFVSEGDGIPVDDFDKPGSAEALHEVIGKVHEGIEILRAALPAPEARFPMLPVVAPCQTSGLPAERVFLFGRKHEDEEKEDAPPVDLCAAPVTAKRRMREKGWKRIQSIVEEKLADAPDKLDAMALDWRGVIHADGNGVGAIFLDFLKHSDAESARDYVDAYRKFSCSLELCTLAAFSDAVRVASRKRILRKKPVRLKKDTKDILPLVPLILGGDDLTLICDGEAAVDLAAEFLAAFETHSGCGKIELEVEGTKKQFESNIPAIAKAAFGVPRLGICAGVAAVKPHFPFHRAYELSEALLKSAKTVKRVVKNADRKSVPCSALDFHVHFDSSGADLDAIRALYEVPGVAGAKDEEDDERNWGARLTATPYVVTEPGKLGEASDTARAWVALRQWNTTADRSGLSDAADALRPKREDDEKRLPRTQQHYLREGLFLGREAANGRLNQIVHRYAKFPWEKLHPEKKPDTLFFTDDRENEERGKKPVGLTWFLDALDLAELRGRERCGSAAAGTSGRGSREAEKVAS